MPRHQEHLNRGCFVDLGRVPVEQGLDGIRLSEPRRDQQRSEISVPGFEIDFRVPIQEKGKRPRGSRLRRIEDGTAIVVRDLAVVERSGLARVQTCS